MSYIVWLMCDKHNHDLKRRTILSVIGSTTMIGSVSATGKKEGDGEPAARIVNVDAEWLNSSSPAEALATEVAEFPTHERDAIQTAIDSRSGSFESLPSFGPGTFIVDASSNYYSTDVRWNEYTETDVEAIVARPKPNKISTESVEALSAQDGKNLKEAIGKARAQKVRNEQNSHSEGGNDRVGILHQDGNRSEDLPADEVRKHTYILDPHEEPPLGLSVNSDPKLVSDNGETYELSLVEQRAEVESYKVSVEEVAKGKDEFNQLVADEFLVADTSFSALSKAIKNVIRESVNESYSEVAPYSDALNKILSKLHVEEGNRSDATRLARLDGELIEITVSQAIGC